MNEADMVWSEARPINNKNEQSRSTRDSPLAPEFRDALTRHLLSCSPFQPIKSALPIERRLNSRANSHLSSFIPASRAASPSSRPLSRNVWYHVADAPSMERSMHMHILPTLLCFTPMLIQCWHPNKPGGVQSVGQTLGALRSPGRVGILAIAPGIDTRFIYLLGRSTMDLMS